MIKFRRGYLIWAVVLFLIEVLIALYINDSIIRPHIGDVIVVIMIYCFLKSFFNLPAITIALITLLFAYFIEAMQYLSIVNVLGMESSTVARVVIGTHFSWIDMICYTVGIAIVLLIEKLRAV